MAVWISTLVLIVVLAMIVRAELRSKVRLAKTSQQIDDLAKVTFARHREMFGEDAAGTFPLADPGTAKK